MKTNFRSGFISIVGRPNVGKSTFLNAIIGKKIAITSPKPQTTRNRILGIKTTDDYQMVFVDTPGIHKPKHELGRILDQTATSSIDGMDAVLFMVDQEKGLTEDHVIRLFQGITSPVYLVINKIDMLKSKLDIDKIIISYLNAYPFAGYFPISAKESKNLEHLIEELITRLPVGYPLFSSEELTDQSDFQLMSEIIREKVLFHTQEEVPHAVAVVIEHTEMNQGVYEVHATIVVERNSQKQILIGKGGDMLKQIGTEARLEINKILDTKIHLILWVKVKKDWRNRPSDLKSLGYDNLN